MGFNFSRNRPPLLIKVKPVAAHFLRAQRSQPPHIDNHGNAITRRRLFRPSGDDDETVSISNRAQ